MSESITELNERNQTEQAIQHHWRGLFALAIISLLAGVATLISPHNASITVERTVGIGVLLSAVPLALMFIQAGSTGQKVITVSGCILAIATGCFLLFSPEGGVAFIAVAMAIYFLVHGIFKVVMSFKIASFSDQGFATLSGLLSVAAAAIIFKFLQDTNNNFGALAVGISLIFTGIAWIRLVHRYRHEKIERNLVIQEK